MPDAYSSVYSDVIPPDVAVFTRSQASEVSSGGDDGCDLDNDYNGSDYDRVYNGDTSDINSPHVGLQL